MSGWSEIVTNVDLALAAIWLLCAVVIKVMSSRGLSKPRSAPLRSWSAQIMPMPSRGRSADSGSDVTSNFKYGRSYARELARHPAELKAPLLLTIAGILGFVALLVASAYFVRLATPFRVAALLWFVVFGAVRTSMLWKRGAGRR